MTASITGCSSSSPSKAASSLRTCSDYTNATSDVRTAYVKQMMINIGTPVTPTAIIQVRTNIESYCPDDPTADLLNLGANYFRDTAASSASNQPSASTSVPPAVGQMPSTIPERLAFVRSLDNGIAASAMVAIPAPQGADIDSPAGIQQTGKIWDNLYAVARKAVDFQDPRYLWAVYANPGDSDLVYYNELVKEIKPIAPASFYTSAVDQSPNAIPGDPTKVWFQIAFTGQDGQMHLMKINVEKIDNTWLIKSDSIP